MSGISEYLEESIEKMRKALVSDLSASCNNHTNVVTLLAGQTLLPKSPLELCPFCDDMGKRKEFLDDLQDRNLLCTEFQARQFYLAKVLRSKCHLLNHDEETAAEINRSDVLWSLIIDKSMDVQCEYFNGIVRLSSSATFISDEVVFFRHSAGCSESEDLLKRTNAHQWLDALPFVSHRDQFLGRLKSYLEEAKHLEHKDVLGRTLLHIACIKNWQAGVKILLKYGANPGAHTIHGSLPLHYAAANGSAILCGLLLERKEHFDVD
jgi:ankyrin repeat protein